MKINLIERLSGFKCSHISQLERIRALYYPQENFRKFNDPNHPEYDLYKDRQIEEAIDKGSNNAIASVLMILEHKSFEEVYMELNKKNGQEKKK